MKHRNVADSLLETLKAEGCRMTKLRRGFIKLLVERHSPLTVQEILEALSKQDLKVNKTTVYREIEFLRKRNVILELDLLDGKKRYEILHRDEHHHHIICTSCKEIQCVDMPNDLDRIEKYLKSSRRFKVTSHVLEFFGLCENCQ